MTAAEDEVLRHLGAVASGALAYERFEAVSEIEVLGGGHDLAALRIGP